jgi:AraC-like DNA-binding protein
MIPRDVTEFPTQCTVPLNARTKTLLNIRNMEYIFDLSKLYKRRTEKALDLLNRELVPNYKAIAARAGLSYTTLSYQFYSITISKAKSNSKIR